MRRRILAVICLVLLVVQTTTGVGWAEEKDQPKAKPIIDVTKLYTYEIMERDIKKLADTYPDLISYQSIGKTLYNRDIWAVKLGQGQIPVMFTGAIHAREWISTVLLMKTIETYAESYVDEVPFQGYNLNKLLDETCIWFLPMANPDGVTLQQFGVEKFPEKTRKWLIQMNAGQADFKRWKADAQGIDLNQQFPSDWGNKDTKVYSPYYWNYKGTKPLESPEAQALAQFAKQISPEIVVNYHSSGNIIYWHSPYTSQKNLYETRRLAEKVSDITKYGLVPPSTRPGAAGYQDYFLANFNRPALTIELSKSVGQTNVPLKYFPDIWQRNKKIAALVAQDGLILGESRQRLIQEINDHESLLRQGEADNISLAKLRKLYTKVGETDIKIFVNGENLHLAVKPVLKSGSILMPARGLTSYLGADVQWDESLGLVTVTKEETKVEFKINEAMAFVNGEKHQLIVPATMTKGTLLVPLRFLSEVFQLQVAWVSEAQIVLVVDPVR